MASNMAHPCAALHAHQGLGTTPEQLLAAQVVVTGTRCCPHMLAGCHCRALQLGEP